MPPPPPLPDPTTLTEEQRVGGYVTIAKLIQNIHNYRGEVERWVKMKVDDLRAEAIARGLVPGGWPEARDTPREVLVGRLYEVMVGAPVNDVAPPTVDIPAPDPVPVAAQMTGLGQEQGE